MPRITPTDWRTQVKIFEKFGCQFVREKDDHLIFHYPNARRPVVIPKYREITVTVIKNNMRTVGMTRQQYFELLVEI
ncbi:type II toxin-antitoxin system HicA family toxin [Candidatus Poribacteria bacterium]|nr:type II toxin-antitoxin system HicA family toxin [Candidatus Poribacteria bacterium]